MTDEVREITEFGPFVVKDCQVYLNGKYLGHAKQFLLWNYPDDRTVLMPDDKGLRVKRCLYDEDKGIVWLEDERC